MQGWVPRVLFSLGISALLAVFPPACRRERTSPCGKPLSSLPASRAGEASPLPLFLLPEPAGSVRIRLDLRAGNAFPGLPVSWDALEADYFFARQGGRQWILEKGAPLDLSSGPVMAALLTRPVTVPGVSGEVIYCAKTISAPVPRTPENRSDMSGFAGAKAGFPLEIVPLADPAALGPGDDFPFRVIFRGDSLSGARVRIRGEGEAAGDPIPAETDGEGAARFRITGTGRWIVTVSCSRREGGRLLTWAASLVFTCEGRG